MSWRQTSRLTALPVRRDRIYRKKDTQLVAVDEGRQQADVVSALQVYRTALDGGATQLFAVGKYFDTVSLAGDRPKLVNRKVALDTRDLGWGYHVPL
jgi:methanesulfonate monooxygenase small subunit